MSRTKLALRTRWTRVLFVAGIVFGGIGSLVLLACGPRYPESLGVYVNTADGYAALSEFDVLWVKDAAPEARSKPVRKVSGREPVIFFVEGIPMTVLYVVNADTAAAFRPLITPLQRASMYAISVEDLAPGKYFLLAQDLVKSRCWGTFELGA